MSGKKLTPSEYAAHRGISKPAVSRALRIGRLSKSVLVDKRGRKLIDVELADVEWAESATQRPRVLVAEPAAPQEKEENMQHPKVSNSMSRLTASRSVREEYLARTAKLAYEERAGKLIDAAAVKNSAFKIGRTVRDAILNVPDRVAAEFAGLTSAAAIHARLTEELRKALEALQNERHVP